MKIIIQKNIHLKIILYSLLFFTVACSKTEYETIKRPYNDIVKFSVAGYGNLTSLNAAISGDEIRIYWNSDSPLPAVIKPIILVSDGATVSPASGAEVTFSENTTYMVTAEDGSTRTYKVKAIVQQPSPLLNNFFVSEYGNRLMWVEGPDFKLLGEYFLSTDLEKVKVYGQRIKDGFEFDFEFDKNTATSTSIPVKMPKFTLEQDTGWHRIWLKVGELKSNYVDVYIEQPYPRNMQRTLSLVEEGQPVKLGQELTVNYAFTDEFNGAVARYYNKNFVSAYLSIQGIPTANGLNNGTATVVATNISFTDKQVKFTIPTTAAARVGGYIYRIGFRAKSPLQDNPDYVTNYEFILPSTGTILTLP